MKTILNFLLAGMIAVCSAQTVPNLPIPIGAGTAEMWNDTLYFFGGSNTCGRRAETISISSALATVDRRAVRF